MKTRHFHITGVVQGVGFRPFIYGLASRMGIYGWVCNTSAGVDIEIQAPVKTLDAFSRALREQTPPLARIESISTEEFDNADSYTSFEIRESIDITGAYQPISPDVAICPDCERELFDPSDRRYLYPFINCTNCGPRFTIIRGLPYDRPNTTMSGFPLCGDCKTEYRNPMDRRFHAQPVACPECGPQVQLVTGDLPDHLQELDAILQTRSLLREGYIVAVKGLGGFHLACDATNPAAVEKLRHRKGRQGKPFAVMMADMNTIESYCFLADDEREIIQGHIKPIVLVVKKTGTDLAKGIAMGVDTLGVMLPYTPLHHLLLNQTDPRLSQQPSPKLLVMTSGNFSEEPIATENQEALEHLKPLADAFLIHDRIIHIRCDDSVVRLDTKPSVKGTEKAIIYLRRSRGYAPYPVHLPFRCPPILATGGELKNTFCLAQDQYAFLSHHIGDMENAETYASFEQGVEHMSRLFRVSPEWFVSDLHPGYFTTSWAEQNAKGRILRVQHHHAHIAACMADNSLENQVVIGLSFDGTGYGPDGTIWGGEVLLADYYGYERTVSLEPLPLPGGDAAIRSPWRIAVGYASALDLDLRGSPLLKSVDEKRISIVRTQVERGINTPLTSSMGRLFDAAACLIGLRDTVSYEAQAAIELEAISKAFLSHAEPYPYEISQGQEGRVIHVRPLLSAILEAVRYNVSPGFVGACFHKTIAAICIETCLRIRDERQINTVVLSGGVWQNQVLLDLVRTGLEQAGCIVLFHRQTPTNDGGLALGQVAIASHVIQKI